MKKLSLVFAASFSLLSFSAVAGGNCLYGHDKSLAEADVEDVLIEEKVDPTLLALLKKHNADKKQVKPIITFN